MALKHINPLLYISPHDPIPEQVMDSTSWFATETMELRFGEYVGRPSEFIDFHKSDLMYFLANGWYVDAVLSSGSEGEWVSVANATSSQSSSGTNSSVANSTANNYAQSQSMAGDIGVSQGNSNGNSMSNGNAKSSGTSESSTSQDGGPYWSAWTTMRLKRRKLQSDRVLNDMIADFTKAYNEGRGVNNDRYNELVSLYALMLSHTEDEANAFAGLNVDDFKPLAKAVTDAVKEALEDYKKSVGDLPDDWMQSRIDEINRKFDALVGTTRAEMVSKGTFNSTVWPTTEAGIERQRQYALNDLKDKMVDTKVDVYGKIAAMTSDVGKNLLDCEIRIIEAQHKMLLGPTDVRNTVFKWMLDFMERRDDEYPGLDKISDIAANLGYSDGAVGGSIAS